MKDNYYKSKYLNYQFISGVASFLGIIFLLINLFGGSNYFGALGFLIIGCNNLYVVIQNSKNNTKKASDSLYLLISVIGFIICLFNIA
ncbi:Uncharacterised protein [[Clostridium] sordellii]|uniref:hypothetical protein n=1 Tax=Paraclostridium sordellii TaxID=1505 RepID=UPI0005E0990C|nr:hypothetical protein [Paeniclostridium sordellii]MDU6115702.1 hypothetical protein [Paeniclostridium sordellii]CEQ16989.1 Uncharacterised protein [[Clostridium] sordellii] [Paeniclostridium sordellii]CEQ26831.1 Uncharacterised protein [[Clostridium] sordellii] [Paeniclostridium sordellii]CEQ29418.1 Uncharacterised protein [[Clostridium] sordellii] [Paeniclostridium sordellii]